MSQEKRPLVDPKVYDLAETWLDDYEIAPDAVNAASDSHEDAVWDLADDIQVAIENWISDATDQTTSRKRIQLIGRSSEGRDVP